MYMYICRYTLRQQTRAVHTGTTANSILFLGIFWAVMLVSLLCHVRESLLHYVLAICGRYSMALICFGVIHNSHVSQCSSHERSHAHQLKATMHHNTDK
jgi:hypothetical protein